MQNARVYSYRRFSDPRQAAGSSAARQQAYAERWAAERGLVLDDSLSLLDEGLSAYHQRHVTQGALGAFLLAVTEGRIPSGSYLVVEGLDRLSRAEPIQAQAQLAQIINAGITVVTASDGKEYGRERLKANPMDLVYSLLVMIRAHEESDTKSKRVRAAIRRQCEGWVAGTYRGLIRNGTDPSWVRWTGAEFELIPEVADAMRQAVRMFIAGHGAHAILSAMDAPITRPSLYKAIKRPDLVGVNVLQIGGEVYRLEGYYPPLITPEEYAELQVHTARRTKRKGKGEIPGIITGIGLLRCGYCGAAMAAQNLMTRRRPDGSIPDGHRRLMCCAKQTPKGCVPGSCSVVPVERAVLDYCSDAINLARLTQGSDRTTGLRREITEHQQQIADLDVQLDRVTAALLASADAAPLAFARKAREIEAAISTHRQHISTAEAELYRISSGDTPAAKAWADIRERAKTLDPEARMIARQLVIDTFEAITIFHDGWHERDHGKGVIDLLLLAKGGSARLLRIKRKTGAWEDETDMLMAAPPQD